MRISALVLFALLIFTHCDSGRQQDDAGMMTITGKTMGTTLSVKYTDTLRRDYSKSIDSVLTEVNSSMSTYISNSTISIFNETDSVFQMEVDVHFYRVLEEAKKIYEASEGAFNPALMPLVRYWGFAGEDPPQKVDSSKVDSLLKLTDFGKVHGVMAIESGDTTYYVEKEDGRLQLDFSAIAKGYGVDAVGKYLEWKGIGSYLVEIGGEVRCRGVFTDGKPWRVGVEDPENSEVDNRRSSQIVMLRDKAIATSGNYRNVQEIDGKQYTHTLDPVTGYPGRNELLSVSIVADECMTADGYATACMVLGPDRARTLIESNGNLEGYFITGGREDGPEATYTQGFKEIMVQD